MKIFATIIISSFMTIVVYAEAIYTVKKGDSLSDILYLKNLKPIYGKHGTLIEILKLNPKIRKKRKGNLIIPGARIVFKESPIINPDISLIKPTPSVPTPTPTPTPETIFKKTSFFRLSPQVYWIKAISNSTNEFQTSEVNIMSKANIGILGIFGINVQKNFNIQFFSYLSQVNFFMDDQLSLSKQHFFRKAYGAGGEYSIDPVNRISLHAGFYDEFFLTMASASKISIESAAIPQTQLGYRRYLGQYKNLNFDSGIFGKIILPYSMTSVEDKLRYGIGGDLLVLLKDYGLRFFYNYSDANAKNTSTKSTEFGWDLVFQGRFFE